MKKKVRKGKPPGATYADVLARERARKAEGEAAALAAAAEELARIRTQRMMWLMVCSMADAFGVGRQRMERFFECLQENSDDLQRMRDEVDDDYAWGKLRLRAQEVTGIDITDLSL